MKKVILLVATALCFSSLACANSSIDYIELKDSSLISGDKISTLSVNSSDLTINSLETVDGELINGDEINQIQFKNIKPSKFKMPENPLMAIKRGGDDSGG